MIPQSTMTSTFGGAFWLMIPFKLKKTLKLGNHVPPLLHSSSTQLTSVAIASLTTPEDFLAGFPKHSIVEITARTVREAGCIVVRDPQPGNPTHANIIGTKREDGLLTSSEARKIANQATWVLYKEP